MTFRFPFLVLGAIRPRGAAVSLGRSSGCGTLGAALRRALAIGAVVAAGWARAADADIDEPPAPRTHPDIVNPGLTGVPDAPGTPPSDAIVLFDGTGFDAWQSGKPDGAITWKLVDGAMEITPGGGTLRTKQSFGYGQYHVEFRTPEVVKGKGQGRGNSGVYPLGGPEIQVLDSFDNTTYPDGQCGAIYGHAIPLVNASRGPGVWQTFDIVCHAPRFDAQGKLAAPAAHTVLHNGVLIHDRVTVGNAGDAKRKGPLSLQDHGNPVRYRNIWFRPHREPMTKPK